MAKRPNIAAVALNMVALAAIVEAGEAGTYGPAADVQGLVNAGLVEINPAMTDENGNVAVRATAAGIAKIAEGSGAATPVATASTAFEIGDVPDDILSAASEKRRAGRSGGEKYPFDALEVGKGFFVPATEKMPEPAKSLASTVSSATARYAVEEKDANGVVVMETVKVKTYATGEDGKRVKDAEGHFVVESEADETRAKMANTRVFKLVPSKPGAAPGAWVVRTA
ncbi:hypothetical protein RCTITAN_61 [Rhodobacter phage RcTitan]|uniref:Uncharacterized protein n=1 Tax=Rhodobacter phage RcTitan TaxID=1662330 RepID=A0A0K1LKR5_9CAUD|nr:hypothetical protein RCTITAN_61 [Rhodobacter phage RcTitan]AKU43077.1 hypothetical protein RCTITAN_61 [Rhodobacter phage RcTitan]